MFNIVAGNIEPVLEAKKRKKLLLLGYTDPGHNTYTRLSNKKTIAISRLSRTEAASSALLRIIIYNMIV